LLLPDTDNDNDEESEVLDKQIEVESELRYEAN
jgi:hypothetical protein